MKFFMLAVLLMVAGTVSAQVDAKYCMTYDDFVNNRWTPIESLVGGRTKQMVQIKFDCNQYKVKTGDKEADAVLKKQAFAVEYGGHLYVNCRNLRCNGVVIDVLGYAQAYRFENNKLMVVAYHVSTGAFLAGVAADVVSVTTPASVAIPSMVGSAAIWMSMDSMSSYRCYILDSGANEKGKTEVTRITDEVMSQILSSDQPLLERYMAVSSKKNRQSASNILPILMEKKLIKG